MHFKHNADDFTAACLKAAKMPKKVMKAQRINRFDYDFIFSRSVHSSPMSLNFMMRK